MTIPRLQVREDAPVEVEQHLSALEVDGELLARAAARAGMAAAVPPCPGWQVRQLLRHVGYVHRWAAAHVAQGSPKLVEALSEEEVLARGPDDGQLLAWFQHGHAELVRTLRAADPELQCWTFLQAPSPLAFWARRQAHETAIHRADAEAACGAISGFDPQFAVDGIDELLLGFASREWNPRAVTEDRTLAVHCLDTPTNWLVHLDPGGVKAWRGLGDADSEIVGTASDLYLVLWNRPPTTPGGVSVRGEPGGLQLWRATIQVGWC